MTYTTPPTFSPNMQVTDTHMNILGNDIVDLTTRVDTAGYCKARGLRSTTSTASTGTETPVLRLDNVVLRSGHLYSVKFQCHPASSVSGDLISTEGKFNTGGTAVVGSPLLFASQAICKESTPLCWWTSYVPLSNQTVSFLLSFFRVSGTGNCTLFCDSNRGTELTVFWHGVDPGNTGVNL